MTPETPDPPPVSSVAPTPCVACSAGICSAHQPTGAPAPCVWREKESGYESRQFDTACGGEVWLRMYQQFNFCPFCGHPLTVER